jgi:hypothetical protein
MLRKTIAFALVPILLLELTVLAGLDSKKSAYVGGTAAPFLQAKDPIEGELRTNHPKDLQFAYGKGNNRSAFSIPYSQIIDLEYGQKAGRRVGAAVATAVLLTPIGLVALFSKKRKHFLTVGYKDESNTDQVAVFELGKDIVGTTLAIVETRSGKTIEYQDKEAEKSGKSGH